MNPEVRRYLWMEFSAPRLLLPPLLMLFTVVVLRAGNVDEIRLLLPALVTLIAGIVFGVDRAIESYAAEIRDRTWDFKRVSAMTPMAMTVGKLAGGTAYAWYLVVLGLAWIVVEAVALHYPADRLVWQILTGMTVVVLFQAFALFVVLASPAQRVSARNSGRILAFAVLFFGLSPVARLLLQSEDPVRWWGWTFEVFPFLFGSVALFAIWAVLGAHRAMCEQLAVGLRPWALPLFVITTGVWAAGLAEGPPEGLARSLVAIGGFALVAFYAAMIKGQTDVGSLLRLTVLLRRGAWGDALVGLPSWIVLAVFLVAVAIVMVVIGDPWGRLLGGKLPFLALVLMALRDLALLLWMSAGSRPERALGSWLILLLLIHFLMPSLLSLTPLWGLQLAMQPLVGSGAVAMLIAAVHLAMAAGLYGWRMRARQQH